MNVAIRLPFTNLRTRSYRLSWNVVVSIRLAKLSNLSEKITTFKVKDAETGKRLDNFLLSKFKNPASFVNKCIRKKHVKVCCPDGKRVPLSNRNNFRLESNMLVRVFNPDFVLKENKNETAQPTYGVPKSQAIITTKKKVKFPILYEDSDVLISDKPAEIAVHRGSKTTASVFDELSMQYNSVDAHGETKLHVLHRLDKSTSGCLMFAKNRKAAQYFSEEFRNRSVKKLYVGTILAPSNHPIDPKLFEIDGLDLENAPATHNRRAGSLAICDLMTTKYGVRPGKSAHNAPNKNSNCKYFKKTQTFFFPLEVVNNGVRNPKTDTAKQNVLFQPITGAKHQIRALCAFYFRAPILGDKKYMRFSKVHNEMQFDDTRLHLHACMLSFLHPKTQKDVSAFSKIPNYISRYSNALSKADLKPYLEDIN